MTRGQQVTFAVDDDIDPAFDALNGELALHLVRRQRPAGRQHKANEFEIPGLEQRDRLLARQAIAEGLDIDCLTWTRVRNCHGWEYAPVARTESQVGGASLRDG